jgi:2-amino-4-hydroxy-6-hydroxymethyldihydropteridine diphosphokinase
VILVGVGSNLSDERHGAPIDVCRAALERIEGPDLRIEARSRWYRTAPVPVSDQPWFVNAVVAVRTALPPAGLLALLHEVEAEFGRVRRLRNEARVLDLDLLAYGDLVSQGGAGPVLPHPRLHERAFVLLPLADVAPGWRHPVTGAGLAEMTARLPAGQDIEVLPAGEDGRQ